MATSTDDTAMHPASPRRSWLREPLLHFVALGGLLFAVDQLLFVDVDDPNTIVVSAAVDNEAKELFTSKRGREPTAEELDALRQVWLDNEVLYREGLALEMDRGDSAIRERVIFKALSVVDANVKLPPIDDAGLRGWFEDHRDEYDEPARYSFEEAVLAGDNTEPAVRAFVTALNAGAPGDAEAGLRVFTGRPRANLVQGYGADFPQALEAVPAGKWRALETREGWRAMRVQTITPPQPAVYESLRGVVLQDWKDAVAAEVRTDAVRALAKRYRVIFEAAAE